MNPAGATRGAVAALEGIEPAATEDVGSFRDALTRLSEATEEASDAARRIARQIWPAVFESRDLCRSLLAVVLVYAVLSGEDEGLDVAERTRDRIRDLASLPVC